MKFYNKCDQNTLFANIKWLKWVEPFKDKGAGLMNHRIKGEFIVRSSFYECEKACFNKMVFKFVAFRSVEV